MTDPIPVDRPILVDALLSILAFANRLEFGNRGLTLTEWTALNEIPSEAAGVALKKLIAHTGLAMPQVRVIVEKLEAKGLVREVSGTVDDRSQRFALSEAGLVMRNEILETFAKVEADELDQSQLQALGRSARIVRRLSRKLDQVEVQEAPAATKVEG